MPPKKYVDFLLGQMQRSLGLDVILFHFQWELKPFCCYFYAENLAIISISPYILSWIMHKMSFYYPLTKDHFFAGCIASTHPPVCVMLLSSSTLSTAVMKRDHHGA